jgi:Ni2+-binding GTPase involved in maturation of urease and hydrogenase
MDECCEAHVIIHAIEEMQTWLRDHDLVWLP